MLSQHALQQVSGGVSRPTAKGEVEGIWSRPIAKGEVEGDLVQAHSQGGS